MPLTMTTIRMRRCGTDRTLHGYVFTDREHARQWLSSYAEKAVGFVLEEVEVGPLMCCPRCLGSGHRQDMKVVRQITFDDVVNG